MLDISGLLCTIKDTEDNIIIKSQAVSFIDSYLIYLDNIDEDNCSDYDDEFLIDKLYFKGYKKKNIVYTEQKEIYNFESKREKYKISAIALKEKINLDILDEEKLLKKRRDILNRVLLGEEKLKESKEIKLANIEIKKEQAKIDAELLRQNHELEMMKEKTRQEELKYLREQAQLKGIHGNIQSIKDYQKKGE